MNQEEFIKTMELENECTLELIGNALINYTYYKRKCRDLENQLKEEKRKSQDILNKSISHTQIMSNNQLNLILDNIKE